MAFLSFHFACWKWNLVKMSWDYRLCLNYISLSQTLQDFSMSEVSLTSFKLLSPALSHFKLNLAFPFCLRAIKQGKFDYELDRQLLGDEIEVLPSSISSSLSLAICRHCKFIRKTFSHSTTSSLLPPSPSHPIPVHPLQSINFGFLFKCWITWPSFSSSTWTARARDSVKNVNISINFNVIVLFYEASRWSMLIQTKVDSMIAIRPNYRIPATN